MAEKTHRDWIITTHSTDQGFVFTCCREAISSKTYGYYPSEEEAMLAAMIWIDQGLVSTS
jgi:hypothetical protein